MGQNGSVILLPMSLLKFNDESPSKVGSKKSLMYLLGIGTLVGTIALGSTLAASINLNSGAPVEFGQGIAQTTACDDEITITPYSTFVNEEGGGDYYFSSLKISGIDSSEGKCSGKRFLIKAYSDQGIVPLFNYADSATVSDEEGDYDYVEIDNVSGEFTWVSGGTDDDDVIPGPEGYITDTSFTLIFSSGSIDSNTITRTPIALAEDVKRITVETYDVNSLSNRVLSASQIGVVDVGAEFENSVVCIEPTCLPYVTLYDYLIDLTVDDVANYNDALDPMVLNLTQIIDAYSFKLVYDPTAESLSPWNLQIKFLGENAGPLVGEVINAPVEIPDNIPGYVVGFDGNIGIFIPGSEGNQDGPPIVFSLNSALQNNLTIGSFVLVEDTPERTIPIRNLVSIWNYNNRSWLEP